MYQKEHGTIKQKKDRKQWTRCNRKSFLFWPSTLKYYVIYDCSLRHVYVIANSKNNQTKFRWSLYSVWNSKNKVTCIEFNDQAIFGTKTCVHLFFIYLHSYYHTLTQPTRVKVILAKHFSNLNRQFVITSKKVHNAH